MQNHFLKFLFTLLLLSLSFLTSATLLQVSHGRGTAGTSSDGTLEVLNSLLENYQFETIITPIVQTTDIVITKITLRTGDTLTCDGFHIGGLSLVDALVQPTTLKTNLAAAGIEFTCSLPAQTETRSIFGGSTTINRGTVDVTSSTGTSVAAFFSFFSSDIEYIIPTDATSNVGKSCAQLVTLDLTFVVNINSITGDLLNFVKDAITPTIVSTVTAQMCDVVKQLSGNVTDLVKNNVLTGNDLLIHRDDQIMADVCDAEDELLNGLDSDKEYFTEEQALETLEVVKSNVLQIQVVEDSIAMLDEIREEIAKGINDLEALNYTVLEVDAERLIFLLFGVEVDINSTDIENFVNFIINFDIEYELNSANLEDLLQALLEYLQVNFDSIADNYLSEFLTDEQINQLRNFVTSFSQLQDIIDFIEALQDIFDTSSGTSNSTSAGFNITLPSGGIDLQAVFSSIDINLLLQFLPSDSLLYEYLSSFGENATLYDVLLELSSIIEPVLDEFHGTYDFNVTLDELRIPTSIKNLLNYSKNFISDPDILALIDSLLVSDKDFRDMILSYLTLNLDIPGIAHIQLQFDSIEVSADEAISFDSTGLKCNSSVLSPALNLQNMQVIPRFSIVISPEAAGSSQTFSDLLELKSQLDLFSQISLTFAFNYEKLKQFSFEGVETLNDLVAATDSFSRCLLGQVYYSVSTENTFSSFVVDLKSVNGTFSGFVEDFFGTLSTLYSPAVPTFIENQMEELVSSLAFSKKFYNVYGDESFQCKDFPKITITAAPTGGNQGEDNGKILGLDMPVFGGVVAGVAAALLLASAFVLQLFGGKATGGSLPAKTVENDGDVLEAKVVQQEPPKDGKVSL